MSYSVLEKEERGYSAARPRGTPAGPGVTSAVAALHAGCCELARPNVHKLVN